MPWLLRAIRYISFLLLIIIIGIALFLSFFDLNTYKQPLTEKLTEALGRGVLIKGALQLQFYPDIALEINDISIKNLPHFSPDDFLSVQQATVQVALLPLFKQEIIIDSLILEHPRLLLQQRENGENNWADLSKSSSSTSEEKKSAPFYLRHGKINNAYLQLQQGDKRHQLENFTLSVDDIHFPAIKPMQLAFSTSLTTGMKTYPINGQAQLELPPFSSHYALSPIHISTEINKQAIVLQGTMQLLASEFKTNTLILKYDKHHFDIQLAMSNIFSHPTGKIELNSTTANTPETKLLVNFEAQAPQFTFSIPTAQWGEHSAKIAVITLDTEKQTAKINKSQLMLFNQTIAFSAEYKNQQQLHTISTTVESKKILLPPLFSAFSLPFPDNLAKKILSPVKLSLNTTFSEKQINIDKFSFKLDNSHLTGSAIVAHQPTVNITGNFSLDKLMVSDYIKENKESSPPTLETENFTVSELINYPVDGSVKIKKLDYGALMLEGIVINFD